MQDPIHPPKCLVCNKILQSNSINICLRCTKSNKDITQGIQRRNMISCCRFCKKYRGENEWIQCQRYSKIHLAILIRAIRGMKKVILQKARFIQTEESTRYLKLELTVGKWVDGCIKLQQSFVVEFYVEYIQCQTCLILYPLQSYRAVVQIKQKDRRKKTLYYLQQLIIKQPKLYENVLKIGIQSDGNDFYFRSLSQAGVLIRFIEKTMPVKMRFSKVLPLTQDSNTKNTCIDILEVFLPRISKNNLVLFPPKLCRQLSIKSPLMLCEKLGAISIFTDITKLQTIQLSSQHFSVYEDDMYSYSLHEFGDQYIVESCFEIIFDKEKTVNTYSMRKIYHYVVSKVGSWESLVARGFLGFIQPQTVVKGFDIENIKQAERIPFEFLKIPIILVRIVPETCRPMGFKLKNWHDERISVQFNKRSSLVINDQRGYEDMQEFLIEIEQDKYLRKDVLLYKKKESGEQSKIKEDEEIVGLLEDLSINTFKEEKPEEHLNFNDVCEIIEKMEKITIEK